VAADDDDVEVHEVQSNLSDDNEEDA